MGVRLWHLLWAQLSLVWDRHRAAGQRVTWPSPRGPARVAHAAPPTSGSILRCTKDFVDQRQIQLHRVGDVPTGVARRLQRLDARKGWQINGGASIGECKGLPGPP